MTMNEFREEASEKWAASIRQRFFPQNALISKVGEPYSLIIIDIGYL